MTEITFSFDIGHSSIGWAVLSGKKQQEPSILGSGAVTFPADDCLASTRRDLRRTRRHIRSTRQRIERLKKYLLSIGFLSREDLDRPGHPAPFLLAAATHQGSLQPSALELWHIIRWYAHNRGYDGNSRWSRQEEEDEGDTAKVVEAKKWMSEKGTATMAHTVCKLLELNPSEPKKRISSHLPYKTLNTAYPRAIVTAEVQQILSNSTLSKEAQNLILADNLLTDSQRKTLKAADIKLPKRYHGGLLFGQLVPRFDNRIISRCPITWAQIYQREIAAGQTEEEASRLAERDSKVPAKKSPEFLAYRFARILANIRLDGGPLPADLRKSLFELAEKRGHLSEKELSAHIEKHTPGAETNLESYFKLHPDSEEALTLNPVANEVRKATESKASTLYPFWPVLSVEVQNFLKTEWAKGRKVSLATIRNRVGNSDDFEKALEDAFAAATTKAKGKKSYPDLDTFLAKKKAGPDGLSGRAPFARPVLCKVKEEVLSGWDPTKPAESSAHPDGENKPSDGVLYQYSVPDSEINQLLAKRPLDKLTNNPLVRHRLLILERLVAELITEFADNDPTKVTTVVVEVARELKEMSGKTAKEIKAELGSRLNDFNKAIKHLEKFAPHLPLNGSLIRKCRIAMDMDWTCPFTGQRYEPSDLPKLEREHIIPFASRQTNALHALVLTWPEVNGWKGKTTARQFILDQGGKKVPNKENLSIQSVRSYDAFVKKLKVSGHDDDRRRQKARKSLLMTTEFNEREQGFTEGALTQSSHLIKLALRGLKQQLPAARHHVIPGIATSEIRKSWNLLELLGHPSVCGRDALRWIEDYNHRKRTFTTNESGNYATFQIAILVEKKGQSVLPTNAFPCPNDQCEAPLTWPEDDPSHLACPECNRVLKKVAKPKNDIRALTHLHHALDAVTIALIVHYFPLSKNGENNSGKLWKALMSRNKSEAEAKLLASTGLFKFSKKLDDKGREQIRADLHDLDQKVKDKTVARLAEARVAQHIPADRSGLPADANPWHFVGWKENGKAEIKKRSIIGHREDGTRIRKDDTPKAGADSRNRTFGVYPTGQGKLRAIKATILLNSNYGLALTLPHPTIIPFHQVHKRLLQIRELNRGSMPPVLRNGAIIQISSGDYKGIWLIRSIADGAKGMKVRMTCPHFIPDKTSGVKWAKDNVLLNSLIKAGLEILPHQYSGHPNAK
ncbi:type II CRISPR RNA-guided endonuclease Cas9 [Roseibacillus persicicus]|uniref:type II CRISPR RNA-guided endonuclease Cas9 n=1 Tax=Roseibacillus persicicus TaxID=454148 RepID=UPI00280CFDFC|nr:type II CRISPR RNA-guided endonuclease Cas9 [Roseibacillus persicicus]MDQ8190155.1 HNH endonuclease domain-containing protein [Roseibacillus persicicus]